MLLNLVGNANKFTHRGDVEVYATIEGAGGDERLVVEVRDTGIGMSREQLARIFEPFTQADSSRRTAPRRAGTEGPGSGT
ncbi:MAG: ATP-binding protein [Myxococcota bacterium]